MAAGPRVEVEGAKELRRALKRMGHDVKDLTAINRKAAQPVLEKAKDIVPVRSGRLKRSIRLSATQKRAAILAGKSTVPYAGPIHFGWRRRNIEPQPFLYDALDERRQEVIDVYESHVEALVRRVDAMTPG